MVDETVEQVIVRAVQRAYDAWALEHPSLASVIDRITLTRQTVEPLRQTPEYQQAVDAYHRSRNELDFLNRLIELAGPILQTILTA